MRTKIRLITTILSLSLVCICLVFGVSLSLKAASNVDISGQGNLSVDGNLSGKDQAGLLEKMGFNCSGLHQDVYFNFQEMKKPENSAQIGEYLREAKANDVLSFELYEKIDCKTQEKAYELQVVLDFSDFNIIEMAANSFSYYNDIVFSNHTESVDLVNFYTGEVIANVELTFSTSGVTFNYNGVKYSLTSSGTDNTISFIYGYKFILSCFTSVDDESNIVYTELRDDTFSFIPDGSTEELAIRVPDVTYLDLSQGDVYLDDNGNLHGIALRNNMDISLTDNNHIHILGSNNDQLEVGLYIADQYVNANSNDASKTNIFEVSLYQVSGYRHSIVTKVEPDDNGIIINVVDNAYYSDSNLNYTQRKAILDMCYWVETNLTNITNISIYHQKVTSEMSFDTNARYEVSYELDSSKGEDWYRVYYTSDSDNAIGYFNSNNYQISFG